MEQYVVYVEKPSEMEIRDGLVHISDKSGASGFKRVMSVHVFLANHRRAERIIAQWEAAQNGKIVSFKRR